MNISTSCTRAGGHFVIRSKHDRHCLASGEAARLHALVRGLAPLDARPSMLAAGEGLARGGRQADDRGRGGRGRAAEQPRGEHGTAPIPLFVVARPRGRCAGGGRPAGVAPADRPGRRGPGRACRAVDWYARRPIVEELHKGMKTGCGIEALQFTTEAALQPAIALLSVVAVFLLGLRDAGRDPGRSAEPAVQVRAVVATWRCSTRGVTASRGWVGRCGSSTWPWGDWGAIRTADAMAPPDGWCCGVAGHAARDAGRGGGHGSASGGATPRGPARLRDRWCTYVIRKLQVSGRGRREAHLSSWSGSGEAIRSPAPWSLRRALEPERRLPGDVACW